MNQHALHRTHCAFQLANAALRPLRTHPTCASHRLDGTAHASHIGADKRTAQQLDAISSRRIALLGGCCLLLPLGHSQHDVAWAAAASTAGDWTSPGLNTPDDPSLPRFYKTESGLKIQEMIVGSGASPQEGDTVLIDYVLRRANGYFIVSTVEGVSFQPRDVPVGPIAFKVGSKEWIPGLQEAVTRMKVGGRARVLIPPSQGYQDCGRDQPQPPTFGTKRQLLNHCTEPLLFELALLRVTPRSAA